MNSSETIPQRSASCSRPRARALPPGAQRPADLLAAYCLPAVAFLLAGAVCAVLAAAGAGGARASWLSLHLVFVGGVSQMVIGAGEFFSTAYLATEPPSRRLTIAQLAVWNTGTLCVAIGVPAGAGALSAAGGMLLLAGLAIFVGALRGLERRSLQTARWTIRWYYAAAAFLSVGSMLGAAMASGAAWSHGSLFGAHLACNLAGWFGAAIVGTLHTFFPSLTHSKLEHPRLQGPTFVAWCGGVAVLAAGEAFGADLLVWTGWLGLTAGSLMLLVNIVASARAAQGPVGLPGRLVGAAQFFLVAGAATALAMLAVDGPQYALVDPWRPLLGVIFGLGWVGMTFAGSLVQLLSVLARVRDLTAPLPAARPRRDSALAGALALAIALLAAAQFDALGALEPFAAALVVLFALPVIARAGGLLRRALRRPHPIRPVV